MRCIHGVWLPDAPGGFVQQGALYLWVETDEPGTAPRKAGQAIHPRHLAGEALTAFLTERAGLKEPVKGVFARACRPFALLLLSAGGVPLPSHDLLPYLDMDVPDAFDAAWWQVDGLPLGAIIATLNDLHFAALQGAEDYQLGADLLFWHQFSQSLKAIIARDRYIPALRYRALDSTPSAGRSRGAKTPRPAPFDLYHGWEWISDAYESLVHRAAAAMPPVCGAAAHEPGVALLQAPEPLLRHFAENLLYAVVTSTPFTMAFETQVADTLLYRCLFPHRPITYADDRQAMLDEYGRWAAWRARLRETEGETGFTLCFRLEDAPADDPNAWYVRFLAADRADPSRHLPLGDYWRLPTRAREAARHSLGADFERRLLLALGHAARVYPTLWQGLATAEPAGLSLTLDEAFAFLKESAWVLEEAGFRVIVPAWWTPEGRRRARVRLRTTARRATGTAAARASRLGMDTLIAYQYQIAIGGQPVSETEWEELVNAKTSLVHFRGQWMELDREKMRELLAFWQTRREEQPELTLLDVLRAGGESGDDLEWEHDEALAEMLARLNDKSALAPLPAPPDLQGSLREYQRRGVAWLRYLERLGLGPCLADDMGLGKTVQVIACLLADEYESEDGPTLIIAPTSVLGNWRKEIERFAPRLRVLVHQGAARNKEARAFGQACAEADVVLTSYALARLDEKLLRGRQWRRLVVDEAQNLKNPQAAQTRAITKLPAQRRMALTGTPVENRLRDLWSIFNFLNPGYLGKEAQFRKGFETPIQKDNDLARQAVLKKLVEPFILRRLKTDKRIIDDLPDKIEQTMFCNLTAEQASLYEAVVQDVAAKLEQAEGMERRGLILATLLKLKQICNHPAQFLHDGSAFGGDRSLKLKRLLEMTEEAIASGESLLIFTQFTEIGAALERALARAVHCPTYYLHGGTSVARREKLVERFQEAEGAPSAFILSLRAGGVGLNLTKASHVFHFDRWWNPAVEDQATDRAFRIGQRKNVFVHKFVTIGTVEEKIDALIEEKKRLSSAIVGADEAWLTELDNEAFKELIALRRGAVVE